MCLSCPNNGCCALHILIKILATQFTKSNVITCQAWLDFRGLYKSSVSRFLFPYSLSLNAAGGRSEFFHSRFTSKYLYSGWLKAIPPLHFIRVKRELSCCNTTIIRGDFPFWWATVETLPNAVWVTHKQLKSSVGVSRSLASQTRKHKYNLDCQVCWQSKFF